MTIKTKDSEYIQDITTKQIGDVSRIHYESLSGDFLPRLGIDFLRNLYEGIIESKYGICLTYSIDKKVVGFVVGTKNTSLLFKDIIRRKWFSMSCVVFKKCIINPFLIPKIFETFFFSKKEKVKGVNAELMVIAVDKYYRNKKIGKKLITALNNYFLRTNIFQYKVVTYDNKKVNKIYQHLGFNYIKSFWIIWQ